MEFFSKSLEKRNFVENLNTIPKDNENEPLVHICNNIFILA